MPDQPTPTPPHQPDPQQTAEHARAPDDIARALAQMTQRNT